jgi:hypothetical protein
MIASYTVTKVVRVMLLPLIRVVFHNLVVVRDRQIVAGLEPTIEYHPFPVWSFRVSAGFDE